MKIAIWLDADYRPEEGGGFSYYDKLVKALDSYTFDSQLKLCFVSNGDITSLPLKREKYQLTHKTQASFGDKLKAHMPLYKDYFKPILAQRQRVERQRAYRNQLKSYGIDLIYYLRQGERHVIDFPFIATNWDIGHWSTFAFPELVSSGEYAKRAAFYRDILPQALFVFAESEAGKQELLKFTNISEEKIKVVPIFAGNCIEEKVSEEKQAEILKQYGLEKYKYFFYPAQFWAHKNHTNLIKAFAELHNTHPEYKLVFTGSDKGNKAHIQLLLEELELTNEVVFAGFVENAVINTFFANAVALCMTSFFGPTNMPPIEAMHIGCPVICSDLAGHREQLGDAALYFHPQDAHALMQCMEEMIANIDIYVTAISEQSKHSLFTIEEALKRINKYLVEASIIRSTWA
ncbi:MAG: glycosyltransferase family 4 protein [Paludibacteraceae bacterium]|nr:glycosyltransferase family 4 protein [Paludibacteraceae bacterium]